MWPTNFGRDAAGPRLATRQAHRTSYIRDESTSHDQAYLPAAFSQPQANPRLPSTCGHQKWPQDPCASSSPWPQAPLGWRWRQIGPLFGTMPHARFGPEFRLRRRREFLAVQGQGQKHHLRHFLVFVVHDAAGLGPAQIGITVTKRIGNAVVRNRIKRRVREAFRRQRGSFARGTQMVVIAKRQAAGVHYDAVSADFMKLAARLDAKPASNQGGVTPS